MAFRHYTQDSQEDIVIETQSQTSLDGQFSSSPSLIPNAPYYVHTSQPQMESMKITREMALLCAWMISIMISAMMDCSIEQVDDVAKAWLYEAKVVAKIMKAKRTLNRSRGHLGRRCWAYPCARNFYEVVLMGSYTAQMFKKRLRVSRDTFHYLCGKIAAVFGRQDTRLRESIPLQTRVCIALHRLASGSPLEVLGDLYGCAKATVCKIVHQFCVALVASGVKDTYIRWPTPFRMHKLAEGFEAVRGIPFVVGAIDGTHIPIIAPKDNAADYYNRKGFHSILLQLTVAADCTVWDYDVGWCGSMHDSVNFNNSLLGIRCNRGDLGKYCLVGDCAYTAKPYMLVPFKGSKEGLSEMKYYWNFIQSSTRMAVERAFGLLKARFRILLKRIDMDLLNVPDVVTACLVLHNICILHGDTFDLDWVRDAEATLRQTINPELETRRTASSTLCEVHAVLPMSDIEVVNRGQEEEVVEANNMGRGAERRDNLARAMYAEHCRRNVQMVFGESEDEHQGEDESM